MCAFCWFLLHIGRKLTENGLRKNWSFTVLSYRGKRKTVPIFCSGRILQLCVATGVICRCV